MNVLNTNVGLYEVCLSLAFMFRVDFNYMWAFQTLREVLSDPTIVRTLSREAHQTALTFWWDFEMRG